VYVPQLPLNLHHNICILAGTGMEISSM
jgi:hypothetical protein